MAEEATSQVEDDTPEYQEMILFYLSNGVKSLVLIWSLSILSLAYISFPPLIKIGNIEFEMPDQRPDTSFASAMLGTCLLYTSPSPRD